MAPPSYRLSKQPGSPFLYADYPIWDAAKRDWTRKFTSTGYSDEQRAHGVASELAAAARAVAEGAAKGWNRRKAIQVVNDLERAAGLPVSTIDHTWNEVQASWAKIREANVKPETMDLYRRYLGKFQAWLGPRAEQSIELITEDDCQRFYQSLLDGGLIPSSARLVTNTVKDVFDRAQSKGWIQGNPVELIEKSPDQSAKVVKEPYTSDEIKALLTTAAKWPETGDEWVTMILLGICLGPRIADCAKLGQQHLDTKGRVWVLHYTPKKTERHGTRVEVPVVEPLRSRLKAVIEKAEGLFFCPTLAKSQKLSEIFAKIVKKAGIKQVVTKNAVTGGERRSKTFHSLRHSLPTWMKAAGVDEETRMKIVGHTSKDVHAGYTHHEMEALEKALTAAMSKLTA